MWYLNFQNSIATMSTAGFSVLAGVTLILTAISFYFIWRSLHRARIIEDTPTARVRSAAQGFIELEGQGKPLPGTPVIAPLTRRHCLWYRYRIEREDSTHSTNGRHTHWTTIDSGTSEALFQLSDDTGSCIIDPDGAEILCQHKDVWYGGSEFPSTLPGKRGFKIRLGGSDYRYTEERLHDGPLYALGWFQSVREGAADERHDVAALLREWKADQAGLLRRFDHNRDGHIDADEWEQVRAHAQEQVTAERARRAVQPQTHVVSQPEDDRPFLISDHSQEVLAKKFRRKSGFALAALAICVGASLWLFAVRLAA